MAQQAGVVSDAELQPYLDALPGRLQGRDARDRALVLAELRHFATAGYSVGQVREHATATRLPEHITSAGGVLHARLLRLRQLPPARQVQEDRARARAAAAATEPCAHGEVRGCAACPYCRRHAADVDGVRCTGCQPGRRPVADARPEPEPAPLDVPLPLEVSP